jgi:hypothetical protein
VTFDPANPRRRVRIDNALAQLVDALVVLFRMGKPNAKTRLLLMAQINQASSRPANVPSDQFNHSTRACRIAGIPTDIG